MPHKTEQQVFREFVNGLQVLKTVRVEFLCPNCRAPIPGRGFDAKVNGLNEWAYRKHENGDTKHEYGEGHSCTNDCFRGSKSREEMKAIADRVYAEQREAYRKSNEASVANLIADCNSLRVAYDLHKVPNFVDDGSLDLDF